MAIAAIVAAQPAAAQAAPATNLVSVCTGVSLPRSAVTDIVGPVVGGVVTPLQTRVNLLAGALPLLPPLGVDVAGLLANAAAGAPITLQALNVNGTVVGPADRCDAQADSFTLRTPGGIAIGGNRITGLGTTGLDPAAGEGSSIALGNSATTAATSAGAIALGSGAAVGANAPGGIAFGTGAQVAAGNSVALGAGSVAARGALAGYVALGLAQPQTSAGEVSIGAAGAPRQLTNVAAGTAPTDAVNAAQLAGVAAQIGAAGNGGVVYDSTVRDRVTLAGAAGTTLTNLQPGTLAAASTDAVNGGQLFATNQNVASNTQAITNLTNAVNNGGGGTPNAVAYDSAARDRVTLAGATGSAITNVQAGTLAAGSTDAVNGSQLFATNQGLATTSTALTNLTTAVTNGGIGAVRYSNPGTPTVPNGGTPTNDVTLVGAAAGAVGLHNVAGGAIRAGSTDAVNGGQVFALSQAAANAVTYATDATGARTNTVALVGGNAAAPVTITNVAAGTVAAGSTSAVNGGQLATTNQAVATAQTTANAAQTAAGAAQTTANAAQGTANGALALGQNSVQYDAGRTSVTLNSGGSTVTVRNIAPGVSTTDAVNVGQLTATVNTALTQANSYTDGRVQALNYDLRNARRDADAGIAGALAAAGLPQAYTAGKGMVAFGGGVYGSASAFAVGASKAFSDGHTVVKLGGSYDTRGRAGASGGVGYQF